MRVATSEKKLTVDEYITHELASERRSEYINGQLFEMPGEKDVNNEIAGFLYILFVTLLRPKGFHVYNHDVKVKIIDAEKYYYPDVFITEEQKTETNQYIKSSPVLIAEVVSESSQVNDYVDKYIDYTKIPSLEYYMIVEPETLLITVYQKSEENTWNAVKYTRRDDQVKLDKLQVLFLLSEVYK